MLFLLSSEHTNGVVPTAERHPAEESVIQQHLTNAATKTSKTHSLKSNADSPSISCRLQRVSRKYQEQNTLTRSRSNTATSMKDENDGAVTNVPYHTIIIDCAPITFVDSMGIRALYEVTVWLYLHHSI